MKNILLSVGILAIVLFFNGCTSRHMQAVNFNEADIKLSQNESAIVLLRPTNFGAAVHVLIAEFADNDLKLVGVMSSKSKVFYKTTPGKHFFVADGEVGNLLEADFEGGKIYYSYVNPYYGFLQGRFEFEPVKNGNRPDDNEDDKKDPLSALNSKNLYGYERAYFDSKEFKSDLEDCAWYESKPETYEWFAKNKNSMWKKYESAVKRHQNAKPEEQKIIKPEYGH